MGDLLAVQAIPRKREHVAKARRARTWGGQGPGFVVHGDHLICASSIPNVRTRELRSAGKQSELVLFPGREHDIDDSAARTTMLGKIGQLLERTIGRTAN
jgi:hypothetical protein